ncbi:ABC transporter substrate-binding protein [Hyphomicrobium sp.]|uniref:ABC transporter substrate-binding protein n=1 Tax=Hyphomicrobium sp. TaxID=82 RepID=UPI000FB2B573|nr:ABC transporter substrate-binding protein [Hyphomicrobium sp.]RUO98907.1 MAG: hopanoid biosynthesis protein HpnM [Hyphomicrobium sp.]
MVPRKKFHAFGGSIAALLLASMTLPPVAAYAQAADSPETTISGLNATLLSTMKQAQALGVAGRYQALTPVLSKTYDTPLMARLAVGQTWGSLQPDQQAQITDSFRRMMIATYAKRFDGFSGESFQIVEISNRGTADKMVKTQIIQSNGKPIAINYLMRKSGPEWKIVDVYLDGTISELASRRAEFSTILQSGGPDALIASLKKQGDKLLSGS